MDDETHNERSMVRSWAKQVRAKELETSHRAVRSLLSVVAGEQAARSQADDVTDAKQAKRDVDAL